MSELVKIVVTVPPNEADAVREAISKTGAGKAGNYSCCSYSVLGTGRFKPESGANPSIGKVGELEQVVEERIEVTCNRKMIPDVIKAIKSNHSYEEPAIDIYPLISID